MKHQYIINEQELLEKGLDLNDYALNGDYVNIIINIALDIAITKCLKLNDTFNYETDLDNALDDNNALIKPFKKLQYRIIYNLIFASDSDAFDSYAEEIVVNDLRWGKINGWQKGHYTGR